MSDELLVIPDKSDWISVANAHATRIKPVTELLSEAVKIGISLACVPIVVGTALLVSYVHWIGAPLPGFDASTGVFLMLIAAILTVAVVIFGTFVVWPFLSKARHPALVKEVLPGLYEPPGGWKVSANFLACYLTFFLPYLTIMAATVLAIFVTNHPLVWPMWLAFVLGMAFEFEVVRRRINKENRSRKFRDSFALVFASLEANGYASLWTWSLALIPLTSIARHWKGVDGWLAYLVCIAILAIMVTLHMFLYRYNVKPSVLLAVCLSIGIFSQEFWPGMPASGGAVLRYLGVGGALPVLLTLKGANGTAKPINGCLILALSGEVSILKVGDPEKECRGPHADRIRTTGLATRRIDTYQKSDILKLSIMASDADAR